jgi:phosphatidylglycerol---prolipoprotein diacylglyceryl transferase
VKPILFEIGGFRLHAFGLLVAVGFMVGSWLAARRARAVGIDPVAIQDVVFPWILVGGIVGARLWYVVSYWDRDFAGQPWTEIVAVWRGGLVFYGGLIGASVAAIIALRRKKLPLWRTADCLAPAIAIGHVFGRIGCVLNGCCYGRVCDLPWAIRYPGDRIAGGQPVHPAQLYEAGLNLVLCLALVWWHPRRRFDGQVFALYLLAYAVIRTISEYFRGDYAFVSRPGAGQFTPGQTTSLLILATGAVLWWALRGRPVKAEAAR